MQDLFVNYLRYERNMSPETIRAYQKDLEQFIKHVTPDGTFDAAQVTNTTIREYLAYLSEKSYEKTTIVRKLATIFRWSLSWRQFQSGAGCRGCTATSWPSLSR